MGFFDRLSRLLRANLNELVSKAEDPAKILDQSVADMQSDLVRLRQAVAIAIASQKRMQSQAEQAESQAKVWYERAGIALQKGEEGLAREALSRRKAFQDSATGLNSQLLSQSNQVDILKQNLLVLEGKIAEAKTKKNMLKARAEAAQAQQQLQSAVGSLGNNTSMAAFERMEEKVEALEATSQASAELAGVDLESRFAILEGSPSNDIEHELFALKNRISGKSDTMALPSTDWSAQKLKPSNSNETKPDLEELSRSVDNP
ncbi:chloroplast membrane-associated 30 kD protein-like protein (chromatophore) [Paulinella micropora]|uniref:Chloroplast membrane-associated 30 kD protein-like protein n=1 Tax=Paulinella micropora TaxID=1928728 RepID=A0A1L5YCQ4_9EUKA|nr:chloroplast membrane-associated 30 kD protein-like protein [Paulinella micropora]APP88485.1 chloroplast membrane-associated 30 kD protein-like protein [Paulinella micropora]AQX45252.1 chloroplast membrane-associated 30 kD protein-like protein [Paulinella micropora]AXY63646.1 chloroplast membrane-associated 30 kD protein-like protein [Paulinella micropora]BBL86470.1 chloroplast membrane-associated 30 kD protein-like protein [Paulinella micropora]